MKSFHKLTQQGQIRRYHRMAQLTVNAYPIQANKLRCLSIRHNVIFRVEADEGLFILRIGYPGIRTKLMVESEMRWLNDMKQVSINLNFSHPIRAKTGEFVTEHEMEGIPEKRQIVLMTWLPGKLIASNPTEKKLYHFGKSLAQLHTFSENYAPSEPFMSFDNFSCDEWGGLAYLDEDNRLLSDKQKILFREVIDKAENALIYWREHEGLKLIHADLHLKNANWSQGEIAVFDFDDCRWGHFLQDWGVILSWFREKSAENQSLQDALLEGYQSERTLSYSEHDLRMATLHRVMAGLTFVINFRPLKRGAIITDTYQWLVANFSG